MRALVALLVIGLASRTAAAEPCEHATIWRDGKRTGLVCRDAAAARGLTVIDLGSDWAPTVFASLPAESVPAYRATYLALAEERFGDAGHEGVLAQRDRYLELFGISPALSVVHRRLADASRHACHAAIDDAPLSATTETWTEETAEAGRARLASARALRSELEAARKRKKLDPAALAASSPYYRRAYDRLATLDRRLDAVRVIQRHLACDGLVAQKPLDGAYTWQTSNAVELFQRGVLLPPTGRLDAVTRAALLVDSRERDFQAALRALRERVIAATGLVEDGSAGPGAGMVLGRALEPEVTWRAKGHDPLPDAAADLVSPATEAAAKALGWTDPATTEKALGELLSAETTVRLVAVALPALPGYHGPAMTLEVELDRGDMWRTHRVPVDPGKRPALTVFAVDGDRRIPLVRWPTTVGGWQDEKLRGGAVVRRWKESPAGPRIWRDLFVGPSWLPPASTPDAELVRHGATSHWLARELMGPSYRAAFGMLAFEHLVEERTRTRTGTKVETWDQGIRTHGTGNLASILSGVSHGCHRILGLHAVRLAGFVLAHHEHIHRGDTPTYYRRVVRHGGAFPIRIDSLGYRIELTPPVKVTVLPGTVHR